MTDSARTEQHDAPVILDAEFHQSVWKPWQEPEQSSSEGTIKPGRASGAAGRRRTTLTFAISVAVLGVVALVAAFLLPPLLKAPAWRSQPLVEDMATQPEIAWSADGGQHCYDGPDEDHAILSDVTSVWSLDLRDGSTQWKVDLSGAWGYLACAPAAGVVMISEVDDSGDALRTKLLSTSTGEELSEFPGGSVVQVVALGPNVGLVDRNNMLTAVRPGRLDVPLWSHLLPGPPNDMGWIFSMPVDETTTELTYALASEAAMGTTNMYRVILSDGDGVTPGWVRGSDANQQFYQRVGEVMIRSSSSDDSGSVEALNLQGHALWSHDGKQAVVAGSRLYLMTRASIAGTGYAELWQVDPQTGWPIDDRVLEEPFDYAAEAPGEHIFVVQGSSLRFLDENLQPQPPIPSHDQSLLGRTLLYVYADSFAENTEPQIRLSAIDPSEARVLWSLDLDPGQRVEQWGQHIVVIDNDGRTLHGLRSAS